MGQREDGAFWERSAVRANWRNTLFLRKFATNWTERGVVIVGLKKNRYTKKKLSLKVCQQYALKEFAENIVLLDTGYAKLMTPFMPLSQLERD